MPKVVYRTKEVEAPLDIRKKYGVEKAYVQEREYDPEDIVRALGENTPLKDYPFHLNAKLKSQNEPLIMDLDDHPTTPAFQNLEDAVLRAEQMITEVSE